MRIRLDRAGRAPLSTQLRDGIAGRVVSGSLAPGERLPPVRELAVDLGLAPNTVAKAYRELESRGYLVGRGRRGTFVADLPPDTAVSDEAALEEAARAFARRSRRLRASPERALLAVRRALRRPTP